MRRLFIYVGCIGLMLSLVVSPVLAQEQVWLPVVINILDGGVMNGGFEGGPVGWEQYSWRGWPLIEESVFAHTGKWRAILGCDWDEGTYIGQLLTVPVDSHLVYWQWIPGGGDLCGTVFLRVLLNNHVVDEYDLCYITRGWERHVVDVGEYAGQSAFLAIGINTGTTWWSNRSCVFIDDVAFQDVSRKEKGND